jgi:hypothetical protein
MNKNQFIQRLLDVGFTETTFNSCNDWGYGGGVGSRFTRGETMVRVFVAYYRKGPSELYLDGKNPTGAIADPKPKDFERVAKLLGI